MLLVERGGCSNDVELEARVGVFIRKSRSILDREAESPAYLYRGGSGERKEESHRRRERGGVAVELHIAGKGSRRGGGGGPSRGGSGVPYAKPVSFDDEGRRPMYIVLAQSLSNLVVPYNLSGIDSPTSKHYRQHDRFI
jgi:hypothetical protein